MYRKYVVYRITNLVTKKFYIGSTCDFLSRKAEHLGHLRNNKHVNREMQREFKEFGESAFEFAIVRDDFKTKQAMLLAEYELIVKTFKKNYNKNKSCPVLKANDYRRRPEFIVHIPTPKQASKMNRIINHKRPRKYVKTEFPQLDKLIQRKIEREIQQGKNRSNDE